MKHQVCLLFAICCSLTLQSYSQPAGSLDPSFANGGIGRYLVGSKINNTYDIGQSVLSLPNGRIILAGTSDGIIAVTCLNTNGNTDSTFGQNGTGIVYIKIGSYVSGGYLALQPDGKILLAGNSSNGNDKDFVVVRLNADGSLDKSFNGDGKIMIPVGSNDDYPFSIAIQNDGKILVAGSSYIGYNNRDFSVVRLNANGSLDKSFGNKGKLLIPVGSEMDYAFSIAQQSDGKILLAGRSESNGNYTSFSVVRLKTNGSLDSSFDGDGKWLFPISGYGGRSMAIQSDGKILLAGSSYGISNLDFAAMRLNANGSFDSSFGGTGILLIPVGNSDDNVYSMFLQNDGKILMAGNSYDIVNNFDFSVVRLNTDGSLDNSFSEDGKLLIPVGSENGLAQSIAMQSDGKILLAGQGSNNNNADFAVVRLNTNGSLDNSLGGNGKLLIPFSGSLDHAQSIALRNDGKILMAGYSYNGSNYDFSLVRLKADGSQDNKFLENGNLLVQIGNDNDFANSIALQNDGKILLAGQSYNGSNYDFSVVRLKANGSLDNSFSKDGKSLIPFGSGDDFAKSIAIQNDGKILLAGQSYNGSNYDFAVLRLNANGSLDHSFSGNGKRMIKFGNNDDYANAIAVQSDGKILLAGFSHAGGHYNFSVARLNANGTLDNSFSQDGKLLIPLDGYAESIALQSDGKILLAGGNNDFSVVRLNANGTLDNSFSGDGKLLIPVGNYNDSLKSMTLQSDGKILLTGKSYDGNKYDFCVVRLNADGTLDNSFSGDGKAIIKTPFYNETLTASILDPDGNLIAAGYGDGDEPGTLFIAMRILCADNPAPVAGESQSNEAVNNIIKLSTSKLIIPTLLHRNEQWRIQGLPMHNTIIITDMNGKVLLRQNDYQNNTEFSGRAQGIYYYRISFINKEGKEEVYKGKLVLID